MNFHQQNCLKSGKLINNPDDLKMKLHGNAMQPKRFSILFKMLIEISPVIYFYSAKLPLLLQNIMGMAFC